MLYHILYSLKDVFSPFNVLRYITFRMAMAFLTALISSFIIGPRVISWLNRKKNFQIINDDAPQRHSEKQGTPTMGGLIMLASMSLSILLWARLDNPYVIILLGSSLWLGLLGFIDDYASSVKGKKKGVTPAFKIAWQLVLGIVLAAYFYMNPTFASEPHSIAMPFFKDLYVNLGSMYILFVIIIVVATSNAVNITDGLDGLAIGGIIVSALTYAILAYVAGNVKFSEYLYLPYIKDAGEITVVLAVLAGASLGFLWFNIFPAQIFMGDTGSLFLGAIIGISAIIIKQEVLLVIAGGVFLAEIMSVVIQVFYFKLRGKRVFRMAPLHHHFELSGWSEPQVVVRFWIIAIVLSLVALSTLKLR
jgi:phospho-N-acetylmuramoyl-pentapeptide-transferase